MTSFTGTMFDLGSNPILEQAMKFTEDRHRLVLSNVANADTPGYRRQDLDRTRFNEVLEDAIAERRESHPGAFFLREQVRDPRPERHVHRTGNRLPFPGVDGPLRHDENNVSMEREMALMAKNAGQYSTYANLLNKGFKQIKAAISERPSSS